MFKHRLSLILLSITLIASIGFVLLSFRYLDYSVMFFTIGVILFVVGLVSVQIVYAVYMFKQDKLETKQSMTACRNCGKPVYHTDQTCPYCKTDLRDE